MRFEDRNGTEIAIGDVIAWPVVRNEAAEMRSGVVESILVTKGWLNKPSIRIRIDLDNKSKESYRNRRRRRWGYCRRLDHALVIEHVTKPVKMTDT